MAITTDIRDRLVALERLIRVNNQPVYASEYISSGIWGNQLPLFVNFPTSATREHTADTFFLITRLWKLKVYGSESPATIRPDQAEEWMYDIIDATYAFFLTRPLLEIDNRGMNFIQQAMLTGDEGIRIEAYPEGDRSVNYYTVTFNMAISYRSDCIL